MKQLIIFSIFALFANSATAQAPLACADGSGPRAAVMGYLTAMHENRFADAFDFVSATMTDGRARSEWVAAQERLYGPGKVAIYGVDPRQAMATPDDVACAAKAIVPNVLSSRDKLNEHGTVEFEIYTVVLDEGTWRIDTQETLFDEPAVRVWFPTAKSFTSEASE